MLVLDGSAGGGQQLRTALALAAVDGRPFRMEAVRGGRSTPGLRPQHRAAVDLAAAVCDADVEGSEVGSETVVFRPGDPAGGEYAVDVGTAGSVTLLFETVLPLAAVLDSPLRVVARGGTDVAWSPSSAYYRRVRLPLLERHGLDAGVRVERHGFYPAGGGEAAFDLAPSTLRPLALDARGGLERVEVCSVESESLADRRVAERQAAAVERLLDAPVGVSVATVESASPGSALLVRGVYGRTLLGVDALGERGVPAEEIAERAVERFRTLREGPGAVDVHAADQLVVPLALAGGRVRVPRVTDHLRTNRDVVGAFGYGVDLEVRDDGSAFLSA